MNKNFKNHPYYFSDIVLILTCFLGDKIIPLNIIVFIGGFILFNIYPNYYKLNSKSDKYKYIVLYDIIVHWLPICFIYFYKQIKPDYSLCCLILSIYLILFRDKITLIYFKKSNIIID